MFVTALQVAEARGLKPNPDGSGYNAGAFADVGIPFLGGCANCHATIAAYNAYPSKIGYWLDWGCIDGTDLGFETVEEFESFDDGQEPDDGPIDNSINWYNDV